MLSGCQPNDRGVGDAAMSDNDLRGELARLSSEAVGVGAWLVLTYALFIVYLLARSVFALLAGDPLAGAAWSVAFRCLLAGRFLVCERSERCLEK